MDHFPKGNRDAEDYQSHYQNSEQILEQYALLGDGSARTILFQSADQGVYMDNLGHSDQNDEGVTVIML